jgi:peroxidase
VKSDSPLRAACEGGGTFSLDPTPERWDNAYYANVVNEQGVMSSDQILFDSSGTRPETMLNAALDAAWQLRFSQVIVRMSAIGVRSGPDGEVRRSCRFVN